jgi:hypothetical protein
VSREVTSKLRSRRYSKWIANAKHNTHSKKVFDLGNFDDVYSSSKKSHGESGEGTGEDEEEEQGNFRESKESSFERLKNEILARNRPKQVDYINSHNDDDNDSVGSYRQIRQSRTSKLSSEEFVALLWEAFQIVSMHAIIDHTSSVALRITSSIANCLPRPIHITNLRSKFSAVVKGADHHRRHLDQESDANQVDLDAVHQNHQNNSNNNNNNNEEPGGGGGGGDINDLEGGDKSAFLASKARRRRAAKELEKYVLLSLSFKCWRC